MNIFSNWFTPTHEDHEIEVVNDYLGTPVYAEAIARRILSVPTPITFGIFAQWGNGKSYLIQHVRRYMNKFELQSSSNGQPAAGASQPKKNARSINSHHVMLIVVMVTLITSMVMLMNPDIFVPNHVTQVTTTPQPSDGNTNETTVNVNTTVVRMVGAGLLTLILLVAFTVVTFHTAVRSMFKSTNNSAWDGIKLLLFAAFTKLPIDEPKSQPGSTEMEDYKMKSQTLQMELNAQEAVPKKFNRKFIYVDFKAWEFVGSDNLWAGIITNLSDKIEDHFGVVLCRLFRTITLVMCPRDPVEHEDDCQSVPVFVNTKTSKMDKYTLIETMKEFGVVHDCCMYCDWSKAEKKYTDAKMDGWFVVEFAEASGAETALSCLKSSSELEVFLDDPHSVDKKSKKKRSAVAEKRLQKLNIDKSPRGFCSHNRKYPKVCCGVAIFYWWLILTLTCVFLPLIIYVMSTLLEINLFNSNKVPLGVSTSLHALFWLPLVTTTVIASVRFMWAMCHSQRRRVQNTMAGVRGQMKGQLGFMEKVKTEVKTITRLIQLIEYVDRRKYKIVINIDDLDRVPLEKIKSILDAVSMLLSDSNSPFICLVALDSRIAVKCIEAEMGASLLKANINGHEYMRKIINIPFCIPEIDTEHKVSFIDGLMHQSDKLERERMTKHQQKTQDAMVSEKDDNKTESSDSGALSQEESVVTPTKSSESSEKEDKADDNSSVQSSNINEKSSGPAPDISARSTAADNQTDVSNSSSNSVMTFDDKKFLFECRNYFYLSETVHKHLHGLPRTIKRIFNVLSLTTLMINCYYKQKAQENSCKDVSENSSSKGSLKSTTLTDTDPKKVNDIRTKTFAENIVLWIVLTDQWPYRISFILQVIEDADQRASAGRVEEGIAEDASLLHIYQSDVVPLLHSLQAGHEEASLLSLDGDPDIFFAFLKALEDDNNRITKKNVKLLMKFTVNLDQTLRQNIGYLRSVLDVDLYTDQKK